MYTILIYFVLICNFLDALSLKMPFCCYSGWYTPSLCILYVFKYHVVHIPGLQALRYLIEREKDRAFNYVCMT